MESKQLWDVYKWALTLTYNEKHNDRRPPQRNPKLGHTVS
jgi:hypothetical protein